jgi:hypothetical protein
VNFVDRTLVRLAEPALRATVFDEVSLGQLIGVAYDTDTMPVEEPFSAVFEELRVGLSVPRLGTVEGWWSAPGGMDKHDVCLQLHNASAGEPTRVDAYWRGAIVARTAVSQSRVSAVVTDWPTTEGIDEEIIADEGSLPADAGLLEAARRSRFIARIRARFDQPAAFTDGVLDRWLRTIGAASVSDLMARFRGVVLTGPMRVSFDLPDAGPLTPRPLPVAAALLIRDGGFSVADLLRESKVIREQLDRFGVERPPDPALRVRERLIVVWVVPVSIFDDADWPGGDPAARRASAGAWLAREGIGLVAVA